MGVNSKLRFFCTSRIVLVIRAPAHSIDDIVDELFVGVSTAGVNEIPKEQCDIPLRTQRFLQNLHTTIDRSTNGFPASFEFYCPRWCLDMNPRQSTIELCNNDIAVHRATGLSKRNSSSVLEIVSGKRTAVLNEFQFGCQRQRRHFDARRQLFEDVLFLIFCAQPEIDLHFGVCRWFQRRMEMSFDRRETLLRAERAFELDRCEDLVRLDIDWREDLRDEDAHWPHVCRPVTTVKPENITDTVKRSVVHWRRRPFVQELARSCLVLWWFGMFVSRRDDSIEDCPAEHSNTRAMTNERNSCRQMNSDASLYSCIDTATNRDIPLEPRLNSKAIITSSRHAQRRNVRFNRNLDWNARRRRSFALFGKRKILYRRGKWNSRFFLNVRVRRLITTDRMTTDLHQQASFVTNTFFESILIFADRLFSRSSVEEHPGGPEGRQKARGWITLTDQKRADHSILLHSRMIFQRDLHRSHQRGKLTNHKQRFAPHRRGSVTARRIFFKASSPEWNVS